MDRNTSNTLAVARSTNEEIRRIDPAAVRVDGGIVYDRDADRAAQLGELMKLPSLGEALLGWNARIEADECVDYTVSYRDLMLTGPGRLTRTAGHAGIPMTYRTFGNLLRGFCAPPRNVAQCLIRLSTSNSDHSPRACAVNDYLRQRNEREAARMDLTGEGPQQVVLRTRKLGSGEQAAKVRTAVAIVTQDHCLGGGDDTALIAALVIGFAGHANTARASAWRGIEESEIRVLFPAMEVNLLNDTETWCGYLTAKNSETGAKSWSISAGLIRKADGMTVACEAVIKSGRHVGQNVPARMVEVAEGAKELLAKLIAEGSAMAAKAAPWSAEVTAKKLGQALATTPAGDPDLACAIAFELGRQLGAREEVLVADLIEVLGYCASRFTRRVDSRPIELLLGRVMVHGFREFAAVHGEGELAEEV